MRGNARAFTGARVTHDGASGRAAGPLTRGRVPLRAVVLQAGPGSAEELGQLEASLRERGTVLPLTAPPIHAGVPLTAQALTGWSCGEIGVFDDWRPERYGAVPVATGPQGPARSVVEAARDAGIAIVPGDRTWSDAKGPVALLVLDPGRAGAALGDLLADGTTMWICPWLPVPIHHVVNPNAVLRASGLLEAGPGALPDWDRSLAYHVGHGQVWVNLRGREPRGVVAPGTEYDEVRDALYRVIVERLQDPASGERVARVLRKEEVYHGPWRWAAPDLVVVPAPGHGFSAAAVAGEIEARAVRPDAALGCEPGWWAATGPEVRREGLPGTVDILSVAPTLARILGVRLLHRPAGRPLTWQFIDAFWASRPAAGPAEAGALSQEEERLLTRRLQDLGYLE
jgi:hypothetical protein